MKNLQETAKEHGDSVQTPTSWDYKYQDAIRDQAEKSFAEGARLGMDRADKLEILLRRLLNKVNMVTAYYRHQGALLEGALEELVERQVCVETALLALSASKELEK